MRLTFIVEEIDTLPKSHNIFVVFRFFGTVFPTHLYIFSKTDTFYNSTPYTTHSKLKLVTTKKIVKKAKLKTLKPKIGT